MTGSRAQFHRYLVEAKAISAADVRSTRIDVGRVIRNAARGTRSVLARRAELVNLSFISIEKIESLGAMGNALTFAAGIVSKFVPITSGTRARLDEAQALRRTLLAKADVLVLDGVFPAQTVRGIRQGHGFRDAASDLVALADLFQENAAHVRTRMIIDADALERADTLGRQLLATLRGRGEKRETTPALVAAVDARNRLWTLFERTWEEHVWRAGACLFLRDVERHVPLLMSAPHARRPRAPALPAPPAP